MIRLTGMVGVVEVRAGGMSRGLKGLEWTGMSVGCGLERALLTGQDGGIDRWEG